jgi:hypothetical protein
MTTPKRLVFAHSVVAAVLAAVLCGAAAPAPGGGQPRYDASGRMLFPADYREWVFLSSGLNMSYTAAPAMAGADMFGNTFVPAAAWRSFLATGVWPDKTVIMLENRGGTSQGSINKRGQFQTTEYMGAEAHVKDTARFKGGWGFFIFDTDGKPAREIPHQAQCYSCHEQHAAADTTFVQFYPTLLPVAKARGTLSKAYLEETAAHPPAP